jgi:hypothetical protein
MEEETIFIRRLLSAAEPQPKRTIHELTRNNTKSSFGDLGFVIIRVISWIVMFRQNFAQITRGFAIGSPITQMFLRKNASKSSEGKLRNLRMIVLEQI